MEIREVDPRDESLLSAWHAVYECAQTHERPYAVPWQLEEVRVELLEPGIRRRHVAFVGLADGTAVCAGELSLPLLDNTASAMVLVATDPAHRGRGHGGRMLDHLETAARASGRSILNAEVSYPVDADDSPDLAFATRRGFRVGLTDVMRVLDLPVPPDVLGRLAHDAAPHHAGYVVRSFTGPVPDDVVTSFAALNARLEVEAPTGELEREALSPDVGALREEERVRVAQGRSWSTTIALRDGEVVALTVMGTSVHEPHRSYQWGTLVAREHRGSRLGVAVKVANLRTFQDAFPQACTVFTWNADVNAHMVGINEQLGFHPVERLAELQKKLELA